MTKTERLVRDLARAVWRDAVVSVDYSDEETPRVEIRATEPPLSTCVVQVEGYAGTESAAWRKTLTALRRVASRKAAAKGDAR